MPIYPFQDEETGEYVELVMDAGKVPGIGQVRSIAGKRLKRIVSEPQAPVIKDFTVRCFSQRPWSPGAEEYGEGGTPICHSRKGLQRFLDASNRAVDKDGIGTTGGETLGFDGSTTV